MKEQITLRHEQTIRVAGFRNWNKITVGTALGYGGLEGLDQAIAFGHELAWTNQESAVLCSYYHGKNAALDKKDAEIAAAVEIEDGQIVKIDSLLYKVRVTGERYADPVRFVPHYIHENTI